MRRKVFVAIAILVLIAAVGSGVFLGGKTKTAKQRTGRPHIGTVERTERPIETVKVYHVVIEDGNPKIRPRRQEVPAGENAIETAMRSLVTQGSGKDMSNPIPEGTRLLGLDVRDGLATVNFSKEFVENFKGGSTGEALVIGTILRTLGQFPEVRQVRILVEGKAIESLGHLDLSVPLDVNAVGTEFNQEN